MDSWTKHGCAIAALGSACGREVLSANLKKQRADLYLARFLCTRRSCPIRNDGSVLVCGYHLRIGVLLWAHNAGCFCFSPQRFRCSPQWPTARMRLLWATWRASSASKKNSQRPRQARKLNRPRLLPTNKFQSTLKCPRQRRRMVGNGPRNLRPQAVQSSQPSTGSHRFWPRKIR
jgi:hypothetical protein